METMKKVAIPNFYRDRDIFEDELGWQCEGDTHDDGEVLFHSKSAQ